MMIEENTLVSTRETVPEEPTEEEESQVLNSVKEMQKVSNTKGREPLKQMLKLRRRPSKKKRLNQKKKKSTVFHSMISSRPTQKSKPSKPEML